MINQEGHIHEGQFVDGKPFGKGRYFHGAWKCCINGEFDGDSEEPLGDVRIIYENESTFDGLIYYDAGIMVGTRKFTNGEIQEGQFNRYY